MLDVTDKKILMIGAGKACREKLKSLAQLNMPVTVIARDFHRDFLDAAWITLVRKQYEPGDLNGFDLVYVGVNNPQLALQIEQDGRKLGLMMNFLSASERSDFISPSALIKKHYSIFVSTFGRAPGATKKIRDQLETQLNLDQIDIDVADYIENRTGHLRNSASAGSHKHPEQHVVFAFLFYEERFLLLKRSGTMSSFPGRWSAITGYMEEDSPLEQAYLEIDEETGIDSSGVHLIHSGTPISIDDPLSQKTWIIHPFLFQVHGSPEVRLNDENDDLRWITPGEISQFTTVPALKLSLESLLLEFHFPAIE